jgi:hypothetical protein
MVVENAFNEGELCHIRLNDGHVITDVRYSGDVDNAGKKYQKFVNGTQTHVINPSYVAQIIRPKRMEEATAKETQAWTNEQEMNHSNSPY